MFYKQATPIGGPPFEKGGENILCSVLRSWLVPRYHEMQGQREEGQVALS